MDFFLETGEGRTPPGTRAVNTSSCGLALSASGPMANRGLSADKSCERAFALDCMRRQQIELRSPRAETHEEMIPGFGYVDAPFPLVLVSRT